MTTIVESGNTGANKTACLDETGITRFWRIDGLTLTQQQAAILPELKHWLDRRKGDSLADYLTGRPVNANPILMSDELAGALFARFRPVTAGVAALGLLSKVIDRNNAEGGHQICPPPIPHLIRRQPSPFNEERWPSLGTAARLRTVLSELIRGRPDNGCARQLKPHEEARKSIGLLILSAVLHGGLVSKAGLEALLRRLTEAFPAIEVANNRVFLELSLDYQKQPNAEFRRWFPDPLSAALIIRLPADAIPKANRSKPVSRSRLRQLIWQCICAALPACFRNEQSLRTLSNLLDAVKLDLESRVPVYLANYASRKFVSHSLHRGAFRRLAGLPSPAPEALSIPESTDRSTIAIKADEAQPNEPEPRWLGPLRAAMCGKSRPEISERIEALLSTQPPGSPLDGSGRLFAGFARHLIVKPLENRAKLAVSTAQTMVISVSIRIGGLVGTDPTAFDSAHWAALYEDAMEDADNPGVRRRLARALKEFQRYLEAEHGVDGLEDSEILSAANGLVPVDANIVSHREFLAIREQFEQGASDGLPGLLGEPDPDRISSIGWLLLTLGYRCGLRRSEALMLKMGDVRFGRSSTLLVRPSELRDLKTKTSTRRIPLDFLLDEAEIARFRQFVSLRDTEEFTSDFIFSVPKKGDLFAPAGLMFPLLHEVMRRVTGDPKLRFHHLRHSFASRTYLALAAGQGGPMSQLSTPYPDVAGGVSDPGNLRMGLFSRSGTTRRDIWAVTTLLGHSAPEISLEHYIHHLDIVLAAALKGPAIAPDRPTVIAGAGVFPSQASREIGPDGLDGWVALLHKRQFRLKPLPVDAPPPRARSDREATAPASESLDRIWRLLLVAGTMRREIAQLVERYGVPKKTIVAYAGHAEWLRDLTLSPSGGKYRHRFMDWFPDRNDPQSKMRIYCPMKPKEERDKAIVRRLGEAFRKAVTRERKIVTQAVALFAREAHPDFGGLYFREPDKPEAARNFLHFLRLLGCEPGEIEFTSHDKTASHETTVARWRAALDFEESVPTRVKSPPNGRSDWPCQWLGIQPVFPKGRGRMEGSAGFRFLMVMAAITMRVGKE